ncbi:MAG: 3-methyl-2-oxobutanoate hydroxymethyltransferase [Anaerolineae bacterium]|nr:3-methyl-2-oxobutanoate hydroxymethyltransferase [Anaerolineae bacterium]
MARLTILDIQAMKNKGEKIAVMTAYDAVSARLAEVAGIPLLLVGDTLGMVVQGHTSTIPVTLDHMIYHTQIVNRVTQTAFIIGDMPFMTATTDAHDTLKNAARLMQEGGASCVKLEGGEFIAPTIHKITQAGIPVMAHIGLTPQSVGQFGGFKVQGRDLSRARQLLADARAVQEAGAFAVVLELVPTPLATLITEQLTIPTIGIGAGAGCSGQVQVFHDVLGLFDAFIPRHTKRYAEIGKTIQDALSQYRADVLAGQFPTDANSFGMDEAVIAQLRDELK